MAAVAGTGKGATPRQRELGLRIRMRREELKLSQEALAHLAGINRTYVATLETGQRNPSLETLAKLSLALKLDLGELVGGLQRRRGRPAS